MWRNHPFSQRNRTAERTVCVGGVEWCGGVLDKTWKRWMGSVGEGGLHEIGGLAPFCQDVKRLKISHPPIIEPTPTFLDCSSSHFWKIPSHLYEGEGFWTMVIYMLFVKCVNRFIEKNNKKKGKFAELRLFNRAEVLFSLVCTPPPPFLLKEGRVEPLHKK